MAWKWFCVYATKSEASPFWTFYSARIAFLTPYFSHIVVQTADYFYPPPSTQATVGLAELQTETISERPLSFFLLLFLTREETRRYWDAFLTSRASSCIYLLCPTLSFFTPNWLTVHSEVSTETAVRYVDPWQPRANNRTLQNTATVAVASQCCRNVAWFVFPLRGGFYNGN